ncbi:MAG: hypothetical protein ABIJ97_04670 [Bacteroidota bacterium]
MKKYFTILAVILLTASVYAQSPEKMSYQAVIRNSSDVLVTNQAVGMQISILQGSMTGTVVYTETQTLATNANGLITIEIGTGAGFNTIDWSAGPYFIKTETDPTGGTNYTITGTSQLLSVPYALHAKTAESVIGGSNSHYVGEYYGGGIVFWVNENGQHGLICAKTDHPNSIYWHNSVDRVTNATGDGFGAGKLNTMLQIALQTNDNTSGNFAAKVCLNYSVTEGVDNYSDWYLPSKWEIHQMFLNKSIINSTAIFNGGTAFLDDYYWSSTESDANNAWTEFFISENQIAVLKIESKRVRAVRTF